MAITISDRALVPHETRFPVYRAAIPVSGKFKVLHGFNGLLAVFFHFGRIFTCHRQAKTALFGAPRFRAPATPPLRGAVSCFATPTIALRVDKSQAVIFNISCLFSFSKKHRYCLIFISCFSARNDIPVSSASEKFPQPHAALNLFAQARPFYASSAADTTCAA
ncbi:MAG: hypothetical protein LBC27_00015 [Spirochaetaceae bacterium]|jgi:hypothetical protein|nr:hypothetical protein [Spirochaetaceae bacterium]